MSRESLVRLFPLLLALIVLGVFVGIAIQAWPQMPIGKEAMRWSNDTDPWLRLTLVRDWMTGGSWYDHEMIRSNAPYGGTQSPWTRPLDVLLAGLTQLMSGDIESRLIKAALCISPLMAALWVLGLMRAARRMLPTVDHSFLAVAVLATMPLSWSYFGVAAADHHSLLAAAFVWVLGALMGERTRGDALLVGVLMGLMLWVSPEALIPIGALYVFMGGQWMVTGKGLGFVRLTSLTLVLMLSVALMIERPVAQWFESLYDSLSVVHVLAMALLTAAVLTVSAFSHRLRSASQRGVAGALVALLAALVMWRMFPLFYYGPMVGLHPYIYSDFLPQISEAQPLWDNAELWVSFSVLAHPLLAMLVMAVMYRKKAFGLYGAAHAWLLLVVAVILFAACMVQLRWIYYLIPILTLMLSVPLAALFSPAHPSTRAYWPATFVARLHPVRGTLLRDVSLVLVMAIGWAMLLCVPNDTPSQARACEAEASAQIRSGRLEKALGDTPLTLLADTNLGAEMLFFTPYHIVASNYHREGAAIKYVWESHAISSEAELRQTLAQRKIDAVLLCPSGVEGKRGVLEQIAQGKAKAPAWMRPVELPSVAAWMKQRKNMIRPKLFLVR